MLQESAASFAAATKEAEPLLREAFEGTAALPDGCPSHEDLTKLILGPLEMNLLELQWIVERLRKAADSPAQRSPPPAPDLPGVHSAQ